MDLREVLLMVDFDLLKEQYRSLVGAKQVLINSLEVVTEGDKGRVQQDISNLEGLLEFLDIIIIEA